MGVGITERASSAVCRRYIVLSQKGGQPLAQSEIVGLRGEAHWLYARSRVTIIGAICWTRSLGMVPNGPNKSLRMPFAAGAVPEAQQLGCTPLLEYTSSAVPDGDLKLDIARGVGHLTPARLFSFKLSKTPRRVFGALVRIAIPSMAHST